MSNVLVDPRTLPGPLEAFVEGNPVSRLVTASCGVMAGRVGAVLATAAALALMFAPLTTWLYRSG